ncbi:MAG: radical SAM protein [Pseudomonadota bacterium]
MSSPQIRVALLGMSLDVEEQLPPCLAVYNLKLYCLTDDELRKKISVKVYDELLTTPDDEVLARLIALKPDVIGLSCYLWSTNRLIRIAQKLLAHIPQLKIILGGPDVGPRAKRLLDRHPFISGIAHGEGEEIFRLFLRRLAGLDEGKWQHTPGLLCKSGDNIISNPHPNPVDMDKIPLVLNDDGFRKRHGTWLHMETSRGCKYRCAYCAFWSQMYGWRTRSLSTIYEAIDAIAEQGGRFISFVDAGFNQDKERFRAVMEYARQYPELSFDGLEINIEEMDRVDIELLAEKLSGHLGIGLQTTTPEALKIIGRRYRPKVFQERIEILREYEINFNIDLICGLPGDNYENFKNTIDEAYTLMPNLVLIYPLLILPGTRFEQQADRLGLNFLPEPPYTIESCATFPKDEMHRAQRLATANDIMSTFSLHSGAFQLLSKELERKPSQLLETFLAGSWRKQAVSDEELKVWKSRLGIDEVTFAVKSFFEHEFNTAGFKQMPEALLDLLAWQFNTGLINSKPVDSVEGEEGTWPPSKGSMPLLSTSVRLLALKTDPMALIKERPVLSKAKSDPHFLLIQRTPKTIKQMRIPLAIAHILTHADGKNSLDEIFNPLLEKIPQSNRQHQKTRLLNALADLTRRRIIVWD